MEHTGENPSVLYITTYEPGDITVIFSAELSISSGSSFVYRWE